MTLPRAERIRILGEIKATWSNLTEEEEQALTDSIAETEMIEKVAEGMPEKKDIPSLQNLLDDYNNGFNEAIALCQASLVSRVGWIIQEIRKVIDDIKAEILSRPQYPNIGKKGCVKRLEYLVQAITTKLGEVKNG